MRYKKTYEKTNLQNNGKKNTKDEGRSNIIDLNQRIEELRLKKDYLEDEILGLYDDAIIKLKELYDKLENNVKDELKRSYKKHYRSALRTITNQLDDTFNNLHKLYWQNVVSFSKTMADDLNQYYEYAHKIMKDNELLINALKYKMKSLDQFIDELYNDKIENAVKNIKVTKHEKGKHKSKRYKLIMTSILATGVASFVGYFVYKQNPAHYSQLKDVYDSIQHAFYEFTSFLKDYLNESINYLLKIFTFN